MVAWLLLRERRYPNATHNRYGRTVAQSLETAVERLREAVNELDLASLAFRRNPDDVLPLAESKEEAASIVVSLARIKEKEAVIRDYRKQMEVPALDVLDCAETPAAW
jgi:hypothetical protein